MCTKGKIITDEIKPPCVAWVYRTNEWGKLPPVKCNKAAVIVDENGRNLCQDHFNRWKKKVERNKIKK